MNKTIANFVRGFFLYLEQRGIHAAILHGWQNDFENELSDVDFVISPEGFRDYVPLVHEWCRLQGWRLCQVLRHEPTAAYCVCAAADPGCVVALDACSDYQRNGVHYLTCGELLASRESLPWGGYRISEAMEVCYRFAKAAAKGKDVETSIGEFLGCPEEARSRCEEALLDQFGLVLVGWNANGVRKAMDSLVQRRRHHQIGMLHGLLYKIVKKIFRPDGMMVPLNGFGNPELVRELAMRCGRLYFRHTKVEACCKASHAVDLLQSTMVIVAGMRPGERWLALRDCVFDLDPSWNVDECFGNLVSTLHRRCLKREKLVHG